MARYKVLKSVAHSFGHSFVSLLNYANDDYVMGHLLTAARSTRSSTLLVDILTGKAAPETLLVPPVRDSIRRYCKWFPDLVARHRTEMIFIATARMTVSFNLTVERPVRHAPNLIESPFLCSVEIEDDRGKVWRAEIKDWWFPEATGPSGERARRRPRFVRRLLGILRGWGGEAGPTSSLKAAA